MSKNITIRDYKEGDWPSVKLVLLESDIYTAYGSTVLKSEKGRIDFYVQVPEKGKVFTACITSPSSSEKDDQDENTELEETHESIVGYAVIDFFSRGIFILSLIIGKEYRGLGYGKQLMEHIKRFAKKNTQYTILRGFAGEQLVNVHTFLLKQGFRACGFVEHDLSWNHSTIHYVFPLREEKDEEQELLISA
ncbi:MAG: N-acetyltransferase family protein [Candidatus Hodarchaeales archaeon]|jgi:ribosomal protein S18 acetylase RimI-like enzyme